MSGTTPGPWDQTPAPPPPSTPDRAPATTVAINATDFLAAQRANKRNTWLLIVILLLLGGTLGYLGGALIQSYSYSRSSYSDVESYSDVDRPSLGALSPFGVIGAGALISIGLAASGVTFAFGGRLMLGLAGAREVTADEEPVLHNVVEEMAIAAGLPKPKVAVMETDVPNAFATGMDPQHAAIGVTRGLLTKLTRDELQGVIGHEMGHVLNMDTRYMTAVAILVGLIALVCDLARRMMWYGSLGGSSRRSDREKGGGNVILLVIFIVFAILAPIAAQLVRFAVSRQREYLADATSVQFTRNPDGLISALQKLEAAAGKPFPGVSDATQHLFIVNPVRQMTAKTSALMATHPDLESRIARLRNLGA